MDISEIEQQNSRTTPSYYDEALTGVSKATAGRKLRLKDVVAALEEAGLDPLVEICAIVQGGELDARDRVKTLLSLAEFVHPKKKATEHSGNPDKPVTMTFSWKP